jgi:L-threonylcarbamoyladenylate synthase
MPRIVPPTDESIARAVKTLRAGGVVAFPTETVYGLGADTFSPAAIAEVYHLKGRPTDNPLIAHVRNVDDARKLVKQWDDRCEKLARMFWPGPLTLVLPRADNIPSTITAGLDTIAVRCPSHPVARQLLEAFGAPLSAPSANRSGHVSPTQARHVADDFARIPDAETLLILDGGDSEVGIESTVVDMTAAVPRVLRPGSIGLEQLQEVLGPMDAPRMQSQSSSPGTSMLHYAPRTPVELVDTDELRQRLAAPGGTPLAVLCFSPPFVKPPHRPVGMPRRADQYARRLYDALRRADAFGCGRILIELPPADNALWRAVHDRLRRAAGGAAA